MIYINDIASFRDPESYKVVPDDRIQKIPIIGGVAIQDLGHVEEGDAFSVTCVFSDQNFLQLVDLWNARATVSFTDTAGNVWSELLIVIKEYQRDKNFPKFVTVTFELWKKPALYEGGSF